MFFLTTLMLLLHKVSADTNLFTNGDFETTTYTDWYCMGPCSFAPSTDARKGTFSVEVTNRTARWNGLAQAVDLISGEVYKVTAYVKLLNTAENAPFQTVVVMEKCDIAGKSIYRRYGLTPLIQPGYWYQIGGARRVQAGSENCKIFIQTDAPADYLVDDAVITHIPSTSWSEWSAVTDDRIDQIRKADLNIQLVGPNSTSTILDIELEQTKLEFRLGTAVSAKKIVDPTYIDYQQVFYRNFEWGVLENALKWRQTEWTQGKIDYDTPLDAMNVMQARGVKMRCHCVFWGVDDKNPVWVLPLSGKTLEDVIETRLVGVVNITKGLCEEWDVNNEVLHGHFFERNTSNPNITMDMFRRVKSLDNKPRLLLNDFNVISGSDVTVAMKDMALKYQEQNIPIGAIGAQGHMKEVDMDLVKARLDILAEAGLPIIITELSVKEADEDIKEDKLTELLTLFFSHPAVEGVLLWGFWDGKIFEADAALFHGENVTANAAGRAYQNLFHNEWRTHEFRTLLGNQLYNTRVFKGNYNIKVIYDGVLLKSHQFIVSDGGCNIEIRVEGNPDGATSVTGVAEI